MVISTVSVRLESPARFCTSLPFLYVFVRPEPFPYCFCTFHVRFFTVFLLRGAFLTVLEESSKKSGIQPKTARKRTPPGGHPSSGGAFFSAFFRGPGGHPSSGGAAFSGVFVYCFFSVFLTAFWVFFLPCGTVPNCTERSENSRRTVFKCSSYRSSYRFFSGVFWCF